MTLTVNMNADMGEGFGAYKIGDDDAILKIIRSASIACGMHAGDPLTMRHVVQRAKEEGVSIGAHPGFNDLWGFGRRRIDMNPEHLEYLMAYQIGALQAMAAYVGEKVTHLKPHGALNNIAAENADYAMAIGRAIKAVDREIIYVTNVGSEMEKAGRKLGLKVAREAYCDRLYDDDCNLTSRKSSGRRNPRPGGRRGARRAHGSGRRDRFTQRQAHTDTHRDAVCPRRRADRDRARRRLPQSTRSRRRKNPDAS